MSETRACSTPIPLVEALVRGHREGTSSLLAKCETCETVVPQGIQVGCGFSGAGLLIRRLWVRVPPPEPADSREPLCGKAFRLHDYLGRSDDSARFEPVLDSGGHGLFNGSRDGRPLMASHGLGLPEALLGLDGVRVLPRRLDRPTATV